MGDSISKYKADLFYGASPEIMRIARELRKNLTEAEKILWQELRNRKLGGFKFRRQHPVSNFIADFYCHTVKLIVELDGGIHRDPEIREHDNSRTHEIEKFGIKIIRFNNDEVYKNLDDVLKKIEHELKH